MGAYHLIGAGEESHSVILCTLFYVMLTLQIIDSIMHYSNNEARILL